MPFSDAAIRALLARLRAAVVAGRVEATKKSDREITEIGWLKEDVFIQLMELEFHDFLKAETARNWPNQTVWVFCPEFWDGRFLWIRLIEEGGGFVLVISFHPAQGDPWSQ